jgi:hypothetical protein
MSINVANMKKIELGGKIGIGWNYYLKKKILKDFLLRRYPSG